MATYQEHLEYINKLVPKIAELPDTALKPADFYFVGWYGGQSPEEYNDEKDTLRFAVVLKSVFDARGGAWDDGERESTLMRALKIPLYYQSAGVYGSRDLMATMSRLLGGQKADSESPQHTPEELRNLFLAAGFIENPNIIVRWNRRAEILTDNGQRRSYRRKRELYCRNCKRFTYVEVDLMSSPCYNDDCDSPDIEDKGDHVVEFLGKWNSCSDVPYNKLQTSQTQT